ncbi:ph domain-containing protein [Diaporthe eres]|nr:ph domain-containing protein [Diaporthe eres]
MDPSGADEDDASAATFFNHAVELAPIDNRPAKVRRLSMEEDYLYEQVMTFAQPPSPPAYHVATHGTYQGPSRKGREAVLGGEGSPAEDEDVLPRYYCDVHMENVFQMKMEIEDAVKRAEYRNWRTMFVVLHGTALHIYGAKDKGWSWSKSRMHGPDVKPDNPPWLRKGALERSYSLQHADVGIAADYHKRRYVIRIRAETDQFLISCVELETFVKWLECLFAAIDVAAPIDERDFPRDQSIPRIQRLRWLRGQYSAQATSGGGSFQQLTESLVSMPESHMDTAMPVDPPADVEMSPGGPAGAENLSGDAAAIAPWDYIPHSPPPPNNPRQSVVPARRLSVSSYHNEGVEPETGKWRPRHIWTSTHDMVYAKLCYAVLLFKSPRKSNFVIFKGQRWHIDWSTGQMSRVQPPSYGEPEFWGPWQVIHAENPRI